MRFMNPIKPIDTATPPHGPVIEETRAWVARAVVGLKLCPFAKAPHSKGQIRYVHCSAIEPEALLQALLRELQLLARTDPTEIETTLLIHPQVLGDFLDFNDFLDAADGALEELGLDGVIQVAPFHPHFQFADADAGDLSNATNRSPYPCLHLLREDSVERAVASIDDPQTIVDANIGTLQNLGADGWAALQAACKADALAAGPGKPE